MAPQDNYLAAATSPAVVSSRPYDVWKQKVAAEEDTIFAALLVGFSRLNQLIQCGDFSGDGLHFF